MSSLLAQPSVHVKLVYVDVCLAAALQTPRTADGRWDFALSDTPQESTHDYGDRRIVWIWNNMGVSLNGGTLKTPQNDNF